MMSWVQIPAARAYEIKKMTKKLPTSSWNHKDSARVCLGSEFTCHTIKNGLIEAVELESLLITSQIRIVRRPKVPAVVKDVCAH